MKPVLTLFDLYAEIQKTVRDLRNAEIRERVTGYQHQETKNVKTLEEKEDKLFKAFEKCMKETQLKEEYQEVFE